MTMRISWLAAVVALLVSLAGCGLSIPADPDDTLQRVRGGTLRVGVSPNPPWTVVEAAGEPKGTEPDLVREFAAQLNADVEWVVGGEEPLMGELEHGRLHLVIGGLTSKSPWTEKAALTKPYATARHPDGKRHKHVMAAPMGENGFLVELERFLLSRNLP